MLYRRLRYLLRLYTAFLLKYRILIIYSVVGLTLLVSLPPAIFKHLPKNRSTQTIGVIGRYNITNLPPSIQKKLSLGLTVLDSAGNPGSGLATYEATNGGLLYRFKLNPNFVWSDGSPIKSEDIQLRFSDAEILRPDSNTLEIKLQKYPYSPLPVLLSKPMFKNISPRWPKKIPILGAGTYVISSYHQQSDALTEIVLSPKDKNSTLPNLKYRFYANQNLSITALKLGEVSVLENISEIKDLNDWQNISLSPAPDYSRIVSIVFNFNGKYFAGSGGRNFRLALSHSIDKSSFPNKAYGSIPPFSWAYSENNKSLGYDFEKAVSLFKKIENRPATLTLHASSNLIPTAENIKKDWEKLGLSVEIVSSPDIPNDFEVLLIALPLFSDPDQYHLWHSKSTSQNYGHFNNPRIDKLLEDGRREMDQSKRKTIYENFQKYLLEESPAVFLYFPQDYTISRN